MATGHPTASGIMADGQKKHKRPIGGGPYLTQQRSFSSSEEELRSTSEYEGKFSHLRVTQIKTVQTVRKYTPHITRSHFIIFLLITVLGVVEQFARFTWLWIRQDDCVRAAVFQLFSNPYSFCLRDILSKFAILF